jgi:aryl carrier-like protein
MKLSSLLLAGSLAANVACPVILALRPALAPPAVRDFFHLHDAAADSRRADQVRAQTAAAAKARVAQLAAQRALLWSALDSADLKTLVAHLRAAGWPAAFVRAMVNARLDAQFAARMKEIAGTATNRPYWKPDAIGFNSNPKFYEELSQVYRERARLMREILGDEFFADSAGEVSAVQRRQFGDLPKAKIDLIQRINDDYAEMTSQIRAGMQGITLPEDREKLALLEREKRADLAAVLSPDELSDYEMRSSTIATRLRSTLTVMDATEAEFRAIYNIEQPLTDRLYPVGGVKGAEMARQRKEAEAQVAEQLAAALGPQRAADFARAGDYEYQQLYRLVQRENLPVDAAARTYDLRATAATESRRIAEDRTLRADEKLSALQNLAQSTSAQIVSTLGPNIGSSYVKSADWLRFIAGGGSVSFNGSSSTFYSPPAPKAAASGQ